MKVHLFLQAMRFAALLLLLPQASHSEVAIGAVDQLPIEEKNLTWDETRQRHTVITQLPPRDTNARLPSPKSRTPEHERSALRLLNQWLSQGTAAGFHGLIYDNRDNNHSPAEMAIYPGLLATSYAKPLHKKGLTRGVANDILFDRSVIGNSSTAFKNDLFARSLVRHMMTQPNGPTHAWQNYISNHLYTYPEHRDHDAIDLYPANWPYTFSSQGSSYKDQPFVQAALWALAAMTPETRAFVERERLIGPTLQMILRRSQAHIRTRAAYQSGPAHPSAFDQAALRLDRVVSTAHALRPETVPAMPVIKVLSDDFTPKAGLLQRSERLFDTPGAVARIWRGWEWEKELIVAAEAVGPAKDTPEQLTWVLLRGDPERVQITPLDAKGQRARITVNWQDRRALDRTGARESDRVDIGIFVHSEPFDSAPAFISVVFPTHQNRTYSSDPEGTPRLASIDYSTPTKRQNHDPALFWSAPWRDVFSYSASQQLEGWHRHYVDGRSKAYITQQDWLSQGGNSALRRDTTQPDFVWINDTP